MSKFNLGSKKLMFDLTDNTTYCGKNDEAFYSKALIEGGSKETFRLISNVKSKIKLAKFDLGEMIQDADCTFANTGEGTLAQKEFDVCAKKINLELCQRTFETDYLSERLRSGSLNSEIAPADFVDYMLGRVSTQVSADLEKAVWSELSGGTYVSNICDGLIYQLANDGTVIDVSATTITVSNVIAQMTRVYDAIPTEVLSKADVAIYVSSNIARAYKQAVAAASAEAFYTKNAELTFLGVEVIEAQGMGSNRMVAAQKSNLLLLTDLVSDFEEVLILPQKNVTGEPTIRVVGEFKFATGYLYGAEVVLYA
jgi:hypothetical protein